MTPEKELGIILDGFSDAVLFRTSAEIAKNDPLSGIIGFAILGIKVVYDFKMMKEYEPTTCSGLIKYTKDYLSNGIKQLRKK
jgi:hypothetical protein